MNKKYGKVNVDHCVWFPTHTYLVNKPTNKQTYHIKTASTFYLF